MPRSLICYLIGLMLVGSACGPSLSFDDDDEEEDDVEIASEGGVGVPSEMVVVTDPVEDAFTIQLPNGWMNVAYKERAYDQAHSVATTTSPDGGTTMFFGDPSMPINFKPDWEYVNVSHQQAAVNPLIRVAAYEPAVEFFRDYANRKFGKLEGFNITSVTPHDEGLQRTKAQMAKSGFFLDAEAVIVRFTYTEDGKPRNAMLFGSSMSNANMWSTSISGISTNGNPEEYYPLLLKIADSYADKPAWLEKEKQLHQQRLDEIREQGRRGMKALQDSAKRHQIRMNAIRAAGDASMRAYYERDAASDKSHRNFLNYINDETTVVNSSGTTMQVSNRYDRYFVNRSTGEYVGGDAHTDLDSLRNQGLNPSDYEEVSIKR